MKFGHFRRNFGQFGAGAGVTLNDVMMGVTAGVLRRYSVARGDVEERFARRFDELDADGSGYLDESEVLQLAASLGTTLSPNELECAVRTIGQDGDGEPGRRGGRGRGAAPRRHRF